jgi:hypothetical protein
MLRYKIYLKAIACGAIFANSFVLAGQASGQEGGVTIKFSDLETVSKAEYPEGLDKSVFSSLVERYAREKLAKKVEVPQTPVAEAVKKEAVIDASSHNNSRYGSFQQDADQILRSNFELEFQPALTGPMTSNLVAEAEVTVNRAAPLEQILVTQESLEFQPPSNESFLANAIKQEDKVQSEEGIQPLQSQSKLFGNLWGENDLEERDNRYLPQRQVAPLGPSVRIFKDEVFGERMIAGTSYTWAAPALYHNPLYFEQVNLERYGQGPHRLIQPAYSAAHFFVTIAQLPYHLGAEPPREHVYVLGHYRPGSCAPYQYHRPRPSWRGLIYQGVATGGLGLIIQ